MSKFTEYIEELASELEGVDNIYRDGLKEIDQLSITVDHLKNTNEKLRGCVSSASSNWCIKPYCKCMLCECLKEIEGRQ